MLAVNYSPRVATLLGEGSYWHRLPDTLVKNGSSRGTYCTGGPAERSCAPESSLRSWTVYWKEPAVQEYLARE